MELNPFLVALETALTERGIPREMAARHTATLGRTFTNDDLNEISSIKNQAEIDKIADSIAVILYKKEKTQPQNPATDQHLPSSSAQTQPSSAPGTPQSGPQGQPGIKPIPTRIQQEKPSEDVSHEKEKYVQNSAEFFTKPTGADKTTKGVTVFWTIFILTLPLTLFLLAVLVTAFAALFIGIIVAIIGLVLAMIAVVAAGSAIALVGIIYGITQLFSFMAAGLYEIGLGVMIAGAVLFTSVILYNLAIRLLPWVMKSLTVLFFFIFRKLQGLFYLARRECYKL